jgi:hypothetical protein
MDQRDIKERNAKKYHNNSKGKHRDKCHSRSYGNSGGLWGEGSWRGKARKMDQAKTKAARTKNKIAINKTDIAHPGEMEAKVKNGRLYA